MLEAIRRHRDEGNDMSLLAESCVYAWGRTQMDFNRDFDKDDMTEVIMEYREMGNLAIDLCSNETERSKLR